MRFKTFFICIFLLSSAFSIAQLTAIDTPLQQGISFYKHRANGALETQANPNIIDSAIVYLELALLNEKTRQQAARYWLKSMYFKGMFTTEVIEQKKTIFNSAKKRGHQFLIEYPNDIDIKLWYIGNTGKWIEYYGILKAAYDGLGPEFKKILEDIIAVDPAYENGAALRVLGIMYFRAPYIPFLLNWPDDAKGIEYSRMALAVDPENIANLLNLGKLLYLDKQYDEALVMIKKCLKQSPRDAYLLTDRYDLAKAKEYFIKIQAAKHDK